MMSEQEIKLRTRNQIVNTLRAFSESDNESLIFYHRVVKKNGQVAYKVHEIRRTKVNKYTIFERDRNSKSGLAARFFEALDSDNAHRVNLLKYASDTWADYLAGEIYFTKGE